MRIVLLDQSSSMGSGFENTPRSGRLGKLSEAETRLGAAKEVVIELLSRWHGDEDVVIIPFTSTVQETSTNKAQDREAIKSVLGRIQPNNGTDIAAALKAAVVAVGVSKTCASVFLITDGESNHQEAFDAAEQCKEARMTIFVYLIDPSETSEELAMRIASITGGNWDPVSSREALQQGTQRAAEELMAQEKAAAALLNSFETQYQGLSDAREGSDNVVFTTVHPRRVEPKLSFLLSTAVHREADSDVVADALVEGFKNGRPVIATSEALARIPVGTVLEIEPRLTDSSVTPRRVEIVWRGTSIVVDFEVVTERETGQLEGAVEITTSEGFLIGRTLLSMRVAKGNERPELPATNTSTMFDRVFASYSRNDEAIVQACKEVYAGLGIQLFVDRDDLLSGVLWRDALVKAIGGSDLFQLFWSTSSAQSSNVREEIDLALIVAQRKHELFIRPVYWQPRSALEEFPFPSSLEQFNFRQIDLRNLFIESVYDEKGSTRSVAPRMELESQITVLSPAPDAYDVNELIRREMGDIVAFLERVTELRYVPAPTLVVEGYTVRQVREVLTTDLPPDTATEGNKIKQWELDLFLSLMLAFHVGALEEGYMEALGVVDFIRNELYDFYELSDSQAIGDFRHVRRTAEWGIRNIIKALAFPGTVTLVSNDGEAVIAQAAKGGIMSKYYLGEYLAHLYAVADNGDRATLNNHFGKWLSIEEAKVSAQIKDNHLSTVLGLMRAPHILDLRRRYAGVVPSLIGSEVTTIARTTTLRSYLERWFQLIVHYVNTALRRQVDGLVRVRYAVRSDFLQQANLELGIEIQIDPESRDRYQTHDQEPTSTYALTRSDFLTAVSQLTVRIAAALPVDESVRWNRLVRIAPTYGICVLPGSPTVDAKIASALESLGWPLEAAMPDTTRVLVCNEILKALREELLKSSEPHAEVEAKTESILKSILVHEHFHAALAFGLNRLGRVASGAKSPRIWTSANNLNEALAAWVELHASREDPWLFDRVNQWITSSTYPDWPYAAAIQLEELYAKHGLSAIRELIIAFRSDPLGTQQQFEETLVYK